MAQVLDAIDLFAGAGGLTLGLKQAGIRTSAAVERDPHCAVTFAAHTPDADLYDADIQGVDLSRYRDKFALVYGGPPCQPFSSGGLRAAAADGRDMIPTFIEAIRVIGPHAFLMENVDGLASSTHRTYFADTLQAFRYLGYRVTWKVLNAADYGVPQKRQRLFVVGMRDRVFVFPAPTHGPGRPRPHIAVRDVLPDVHRPLGEPPGSRVFYARNPDLRPSPFDGHLFNGGDTPELVRWGLLQSTGNGGTGRTEPRPTCHTAARASQTNPLTGRSKAERRDRPSTLSGRLCDGSRRQRPIAVNQNYRRHTRHRCIPKRPTLDRQYRL